MTDTLVQFHHIGKDGKPRGVFDQRIYEYLKELYNPITIEGEPYIYTGGVYRPDRRGTFLKTEIKKLIMPSYVRSDTINRVYRLFAMDNDIVITGDMLNNHPKEWVNFQNGFFDPIAGEMKPHSASYYTINQIPREYNPAAKPTGEVTEKWLQYFAPEPEDREMLLQYCGYCFTTDTRQQLFMIVVGRGGTGKSTLINLMQHCIGDDNFSSMSMQQLTGRFNSQQLVGNLANLSSDNEIEAMEDVTKIKKITGEDSMEVEKKGVDPYKVRPYAKLMFSANELSRILNEKTDGYYRRLRIFQVDDKPESVDLDLLEKLKGESDYFIHLCMDALGRLYRSGNKVVNSPRSVAAIQELWDSSDSVQRFINTCCDIVPSNQQTYRPWTSQLFAKYESWAEYEGVKALTRTRFYQSIALKGYRKSKYNGHEYFVGLQLKDEYKL